MTINYIQKNKELFQAIIDGKEIQYYDDEEGWITKENNFGLYLETEYRVKPELKLVPLDIKDVQCIPVKSKLNKNIHLITSIIITSNTLHLGFLSITTKELFEKYENLDGSPLGKYVNK